MKCETKYLNWDGKSRLLKVSIQDFDDVSEPNKLELSSSKDQKTEFYVNLQIYEYGKYVGLIYRKTGNNKVIYVTN